MSASFCHIPPRITENVIDASLGIWIYNWDSQFRGSTILGFVGAGGIGLYLRERISILEYHGALGIIMIIIALVIISEVASDRLRHRFY